MEENSPKINSTHTPFWAQVLSDLFSPLLMPTYGMAVSMAAIKAPVLGIMIGTSIIALITAVVPFIIILILMKIGKVKDMAISNRKERVFPMSVAVSCYFAAALVSVLLGLPMWLRLFFFGAALATTIAIVITGSWKISAHLTAAGGFTALMAWLAFMVVTPFAGLHILSASIVISGLLGSSRLALKRHTLGQLAAGYVLGFAVCMSFTLIFCL